MLSTPERASESLPPSGLPLCRCRLQPVRTHHEDGLVEGRRDALLDARRVPEVLRRRGGQAGELLLLRDPVLVRAARRGATGAHARRLRLGARRGQGDQVLPAALRPRRRHAPQDPQVGPRRGHAGVPGRGAQAVGRIARHRSRLEDLHVHEGEATPRARPRVR